MINRTPAYMALLHFTLTTKGDLVECLPDLIIGEEII